MRRTVLLLSAIIFINLPYTVHSQLLKKFKDKVVQKINSKTDAAMDKTIDNTEKAIEGKGEGEKKDDIQDKGSGTGIKSYSKYDFVPGDKIIYAEDFSQDAIGELPLKWNTNGSGELVTVEGITGKWLQIKEESNYKSPMDIKMPENYTMEFDLLVAFKEDQRVPGITVNIVKPLGADDSHGEVVNKNAGIKLTLIPNGGQSGQPDRVSLETFDSRGNLYFNNDRTLTSVFTDLNKKGVPIHVALWVQKERLRVWLNQAKVFDLPKAMSKDVIPSTIDFAVGTYGGPQNNYQYYISNIKAAIAAPDTRSKLITEGKWVTSGILFDVNSDKIKPVSYGVLKEIAGVLTENPGIKVKIIGHTDSDGNPDKNMELSKKRAVAVKEALASEFKIDMSRMDTDGMGQTKPIADNNTPEGKAQNRRVEFVKL